jgi:hypothetical protein
MLVFPQVNLNGTNVDELCEQAREGYEAVTKARMALYKMMPHGRDYQTLPEGAYRQARDQHEARIHKLNEIKDDLLAIFHALMDQRPEPKE